MSTLSCSTDKSQNIIQRLFECAQEKYFQEFKSILKEFPYLDIVSAFKDDETPSFLIMMVTHKNMDLVKFILNYIQTQVNQGLNSFDKNTLKKYINMGDRYGFTALHVACFNGDLIMVEYLIEKGADMYAKNQSGLNVMHSAAQGDSPLILYYFKQLGFDIEELDDEEKTPLYWAVFSDSEYACQFLISWGADVNKQDIIERQTPLHIVTDTRIARRLLIAGAEKNIMDKRGNLPYELAEKNEHYRLAQMLKDEFSIQEFCNLRLPLSPPRQKRRMIFIFSFLTLSIILGNLFFVLPFLEEDKDPMCLAFYCLSFLNITLLCIVSHKNPGYFQIQKERKDMLELFKKCQYDYSILCSECNLVKPERSKHCYFCQRCVKVYDHHCPWVNNCIGANNYLIFFTFLFFLWVFAIYLIILNSFALSHNHINQQSEYAFIDPFKNDNFLQISELLLMIFSIYSLTILGIFIIPITILLFIQIQNICYGQTQLERYSNQQNKKTHSESTKIEKEMEDSFKLAQTNFGEEESQNGQSFLSSQSRLDQIVKAGSKRSMLQNCADMLVNNSKNPKYEENSVL
ncbi:hypothetical protein ABPG74_015615 [Tetrahymena malaccensis]